ncbi:hypothetical protein [Paenibacillus taichungensis]
MDMSKVPGDEHANSLFPKHNQNLYDQIKLCIISDYFPKTLSKLPKGVLEFFIRDGELAINFHTTKTSLRGPAPIVESTGMTRGKLLTFLMLVEDKITAHPAIDYGSIIINYELLEDGEVDGDIEFKTQVNHRRR